MDFAQALRASRTRRRLSQLELAVRAGTTQRHISFIENGRSAPGRALVARLADSLALPPRERNGLLLAAGYAPAHPQRDLADPALAPALEALGHILAGHMPYPAIVVDRWGGVVGVNAAFSVMTEGCDPALLGPGMNLLRLALHPGGLAPRIRNFPQWARHVIEAVREELRRDPDDRLSALHDELAGYVPDSAPDADALLGFTVPMELETVRRGTLRLMTTVAKFATAADVTIAELKLEAFLPADRETADALNGTDAVPGAAALTGTDALTGTAALSSADAPTGTDAPAPAAAPTRPGADAGSGGRTRERPERGPLPRT
ncbi:helix-turn-helix transcriptional regulator [Streptomyces sp. HPF1205]|uniref:helix-turn-helix domain-containing protein n=1 Tax=Streptomyces sp. HPF1205 TaxID=2873262 RepID=UPI0027E0FB7A|nr:helix-turn-helix transcriptional regulator [Streptomyces sp. HPF1205]